MQHPVAVHIHDDGLIHMPFPDCKRVYANVLHALQRSRAVVALKVSVVYLLYHVPRHAKVIRHILQGHSTEQVHHILGERWV